MTKGRAVIVGVLAAFNVRYVLVGGVAAQLRGWSEVTLDVDLVPDPDEANLQRLARALNDLDVRWRVAGAPDGHPLAAPLDAATIASHTSLAFTCGHGPLDIVRHPDGIGGYGELSAEATELELEGVLVMVASGRHIVQSKIAADRLKDRAQLPGIIAAFRARGELPPEDA